MDNSLVGGSVRVGLDPLVGTIKSENRGTVYANGG